ncbi:uncharacterized protein B0H64DRAFT_206348 [Chaetomium fimeti]|uniref:Uncharacterized protein n=1 Tax=Chaetomium fimeti TaxID=1854472 RepID=A0AAE0HAT3_9PEZI|nr:hypothetical protein B0H64DRAFT_206348 [Chaetomium fimeti]
MAPLCRSLALAVPPRSPPRPFPAAASEGTGTLAHSHAPRARRSPPLGPLPQAEQKGNAVIHNMGMHCGQGVDRRLAGSLGAEQRRGGVKMRLQRQQQHRFALQISPGADHREGDKSLKSTDRHGFADGCSDEFDGRVLSLTIVIIPISRRPRRAQYAFISQENRNTSEFNQPLFRHGTWGGAKNDCPYYLSQVPRTGQCAAGG